MIPGARAVPRVPAPSRSAFLRDHERARRPVVITGALAGRPALDSWSPEHLGAFGEFPVEVRISRRGQPQLFDGNPGAAFGFRTVPLRVALEQLERPDDELWYVQQCELDRLPRLAEEVGALDFLPRQCRTGSKLWISGPGTINPLHWDTHHAVLAQLRGVKRFMIFPPEDSPRLASLEHRSLWRTSALDLSAVDRTRFPRLDRATAWSCSVGPGDVLFIPYAWWHYMESDEPSLSVTWWWPPSLAVHLRDSAREHAANWLKRALRRLRAADGRSPGPSRASGGSPRTD